MKRFQFSFVVAVLMATVSVPAQRSGDVRGERNVRGGIETTRQHAGATSRGSRSVDVRAQTSDRTRGNPSNRGGRGYESPERQGAGRHGSHGHAPARRVPVQTHGYWRVVYEPVLVCAGYWHSEYVPAVCGWVYDSCGHRVWGTIEPAHHHRVWVPPQYNQCERRIWVCN